MLIADRFEIIEPSGAGAMGVWATTSISSARVLTASEAFSSVVPPTDTRMPVRLSMRKPAKENVIS